MDISELREQVCFCGHFAGDHADTEAAWGAGQQTEGLCLIDGCACAAFRIEES